MERVSGEAKFSTAKKSQGGSKKLPASVSKTAVRNGAFYDLASFGSRFTAIYPELRAAFKANVDTYGEFLAEDFFRNAGGNALVYDIIRQNDSTKMKKLFNLLNEMYDNGVNDVQSLIAVTILGEPLQDEKMLANCVDYMNDELCVNVIRVNKYLHSSAGKSAAMRLQNPPRYKPKKAKKPNLLSSLLGGGGSLPGSGCPGSGAAEQHQGGELGHPGDAPGAGERRDPLCGQVQRPGF